MYYIFYILFSIFTISLAYFQGPVTQPPYSNHKNFNLLPLRGICGLQELQDKIWGGNVTSLDEFPWMALLEYNRNGQNIGFQCGGSLINERYIVTAAHCFVGAAETALGKMVSVRLGEHNLSTKEDCVDYPDDDTVCSDPPVNIEVEEIIPHPNYDDYSRSKYDDIALVRLKKPVKFTSYIKPICLPLNNERSKVGENITVSGWGQTEKGKKSDIKLKADIPVMSNQDCARVYIKDLIINENQLCAGGKKGIDSCNGDSGGPIMATFPDQIDIYLEGVVSFGMINCGLENVPGVYTRVHKYINWILDNMKP